MKLAIALTLALSAISFSSNASPYRCDFENVEGELFEFAHPQAILLHHDAVSIVEKNTYPFWYKDANTTTPLEVDGYFGRMAKIQSDEPVKRVSENTFKDVRDKLKVRYYSAIADNCEQIYVRVVENEFPNYFSPKIDFVDHQFDFLEQEKWIGITMEENVRSLETRHIDYITVKPAGHNKVFFINDVGNKSVPLAQYVSLKVLDAKRSPLYLKGEMLSNYAIEVMYQGERGYVNADYRYIVNGNPLLDVKSDYLGAISSGKLVFGMKKSDVLLSKGMPLSSESFPVYKTNVGNIVDYTGNVRQKNKVLLGYITHWTYEDIEYPIIFTMEGVMKESKQRFSIFDAKGLPEFMEQI